MFFIIAFSYPQISVNKSINLPFILISHFLPYCAVFYTIISMPFTLRKLVYCVGLRFITMSQKTWRCFFIFVPKTQYFSQCFLLCPDIWWWTWLSIFTASVTISVNEFCITTIEHFPRWFLYLAEDITHDLLNM